MEEKIIIVSAILFMWGCPLMVENAYEDLNAEVTTDRRAYAAAVDDRILSLQATAIFKNTSDTQLYLHRRRFVLEKRTWDEWKPAFRHVFKLSLISNDGIEVKAGGEFEFAINIVTYVEGHPIQNALLHVDLKANVNPMPAEFGNVPGEYRIVLYAYESFDYEGHGFTGRLPKEMTTSNAFAVRLQ